MGIAPCPGAENGAAWLAAEIGGGAVPVGRRGGPGYPRKDDAERWFLVAIASHRPYPLGPACVAHSSFLSHSPMDPRNGHAHVIPPRGYVGPPESPILSGWLGIPLR